MLAVSPCQSVYGMQRKWTVNRWIVYSELAHPRKTLTSNELTLWKIKQKKWFFLFWSFPKFERRNFKENWDKLLLLKYWSFRWGQFDISIIDLLTSLKEKIWRSVFHLSKTHRQISEKRCLKCIDRVIKHANFQLHILIGLFENWQSYLEKLTIGDKYLNKPIRLFVY